jgi:1,4-dihydroxy-2-naphthoyl-CoA hydrolase
MSIWHNAPSLTEINALNEGTLGENLNITFTEIGPDLIKACMPVDNRTKQPFGLLHGGASVALAETLGSVASWCAINRDLFIGVGIEINANHVKAVTSGIVTGICTPIHISGKNHVWDIKIYNDRNELCCVSRFTATVVAKNRFS